jgi:hypothetical protein
VRINPIALDAKQLREFSGINELPRRSSPSRCDQVGHLSRDLLDVGWVEPHGRAPPQEFPARGLLLVACRMDAAARSCGMGSLPVSRASSPPSKQIGLPSV